MNSHNFEQARQYAEKRLEGELSPHLVYHGIAHTREEVVPAVETLAAMEIITGKSLHLLRTAGWFHDLGYVEQAVHHELISARILRTFYHPLALRKLKLSLSGGRFLPQLCPSPPETASRKF